jgi:hypothetical protein
MAPMLRDVSVEEVVEFALACERPLLALSVHDQARLAWGLSSDLVRKIMIDNPYATYGRLQQVVRETTP